MNLDIAGLYAALMHEVKNTLGLMSMTLDEVRPTGDPAHDKSLNDARLLSQRVAERLQQALLLYKAINGQLHPMVDAYSPADVLDELGDQAQALVRGRIKVDVGVADDVPLIWFFDRNLVEMALVNAIHNSIQYARARIVLEASMEDGRLCLSVRDDSAGYPEHILECVRENRPYQSQGTGLGLQFARLVAEAHTDRGRCGELHLANEHGAVLRLLLP